ncbi:Uncharacterised protein [Dermatophilus congolensis]|uniref:Uncharacterized protein n=1 Tax=Dermatophilus congolensis TaxID=1863 RepID=A0AA46BLC8_9MICO|nr:Uncharacterised protein [Dermatophilus congolensis]
MCGEGFGGEGEPAEVDVGCGFGGVFVDVVGGESCACVAGGVDGVFGACGECVEGKGGVGAVPGGCVGSVGGGEVVVEGVLGGVVDVGGGEVAGAFGGEGG